MKKGLFALFIFPLLAFADLPSKEMVESIKKGDIGGVKSLLKTQNANAALANGKTTLMLAAWEKKPQIAKLLVESGANVNASDNEGKTALMLAVWREDLEGVKTLISLGADKNQKNKEGLNAKDIAQLSGAGDIIDYLKE